jgi:predicted acyl esterase
VFLKPLKIIIRSLLEGNIIFIRKLADTMSHTIGGIEVAFTQSNRNFHHWWADYNPSTTTLPEGWQREPDRRALPESIIWENDVAIPMRDGVKLRADVFQPAKLDSTPLPA